MRSKIKKIAKVFLRPGSRRFRLARRIAIKLRVIPSCPPDSKFAEWIERTEPFLWSEAINLKYQPLISIVVPVFNPHVRDFMSMVYSVVNQESYQNWELVLVNASTKAKVAQVTKDCENIDTRVKVIDLQDNKGIAGNTNLGLSNCSGEYIGLLDHDDILAPRALYEVACLLQGKQKPQIIYSDEDKLTENGEHRFDPFFKPDWSPQLLRQVNYLNHFMVIEKSLIDKVGGYRPGFEGAQDYDLFLRLVDKDPQVAHVPKILYHWRAAQGSTAHDFSTKKNIIKAGVKALEEHLDRNRQKGEVGYLIKQPGFYEVSYQPEPSTKVAVLILPTKSIEQYSYLAAHILNSLNDVSIDTEVFLMRTIDKFKLKNARVSIRSISAVTNKQYIDKVLKQTDANVFILFNAAVIPKTKSWVERLAGIVSQVDNIGAVAPILLDPKTSIIRDAGFVKYGKTAVGLFQEQVLKSNTYAGNTVWSRNVDYLSGRVYVMKRGVFEKYMSSRGSYGRENLSDSGAFGKIRSDGLEVVVYPQVRMEYRGELAPSSPSSYFLNTNLSLSGYSLSLPKTINVPPEINDEK